MHAPLAHQTLLDTDAVRDRARLRFSALPRPFLKWAGSKQALLPHIASILPQRFNNYFEPFLGSAALFFCLQPVEAVLNDRSRELIDSYEAVRANPSAIVRYLKEFKPTKAAYYSVRANRSAGYLKRASELIYLNKLCWNGLYRVNSDGGFNVPYGAPKNKKTFFDYDNIYACSRALKRANLMSTDFKSAIEMARPDDLVFLDPPYVTKHNNNGFRDWNETLFSWSDQQRLARVAKQLKRSGVNVIVCNAFHRDIIDMYDGFNLKVIERSTTLASNTKFRGTVSEVILFG